MTPPLPPIGLSFVEQGAHFTLFASHASKVFLALFRPGEQAPFQERAMEKKEGGFWHLTIPLPPPDTEYAFRCEGPNDPGHGLLYNGSNYLVDPYAKVVSSRSRWNEKDLKKWGRGVVAPIEPFDWEGVEKPKIPLDQLVIYEMHVRGFTEHPSSKVEHPGSYLGMIEKIPYLKRLGVNAVELLPVYEFDETDSPGIDPKTKKHLPNYWGYNPLYYFAPMRRFAAGSDLQAPIREFKTMVREMHRAGIEVLLDVVYNHTGEGGCQKKVVHFRGLDNTVYYMVDEKGHYRDYTGCGNTVNSNHPVVQKLILDSLHYWQEEMQVDGFRFDLASTFTRDLRGVPIANPPILEAMERDPILRKGKWIAEAWDAAGLYQVGYFPRFGRWSEWNGRFRDPVRRFIKGTDQKAGSFSGALCGSEGVYGSSKTPLSSVNFVTAHDGFCLHDLVSYDQKHNEANGEMNRDGANQNDSWNCGAEGESASTEIIALRQRQMRNFLLALFAAQGIPMLLMGDEYGHTRKGNNNPYVQDNELNWFLWDLAEKRKGQIAFTEALIAFRQANASLRSSRFLTEADIEWHGEKPRHPDWSGTSRFVACTLKGDPSLYLAFNAFFHPVKMTLPPESVWEVVVRTDAGWEAQPLLTGSYPTVTEVELPPYSALLAREKKGG